MLGGGLKTSAEISLTSDSPLGGVDSLVYT